MRIAVIDSGVAIPHQHIRAIAGGVTIRESVEIEDFRDQVGHGTAVMAAILERAPADVECLAVRVFERSLRTKVEILVRALEWSIENGADVINLSLGTTNEDHAERFRPFLDRAVFVSPANAVPGSLDGVIAVECDFDCPRDHFYFRDGKFFASGYARAIPGVPPEKNLHGVSFAVANITGFIARECVGLQKVDFETVREKLKSAANPRK